MHLNNAKNKAAQKFNLYRYAVLCRVSPSNGRQFQLQRESANYAEAVSLTISPASPPNRAPRGWGRLTAQTTRRSHPDTVGGCCRKIRRKEKAPRGNSWGDSAQELGLCLSSLWVVFSGYILRTSCSGLKQTQFSQEIVSWASHSNSLLPCLSNLSLWLDERGCLSSPAPRDTGRVESRSSPSPLSTPTMATFLL